MKIVSNIAVLILLAILPVKLAGQLPEVVVKHYSVDDGLAYSAVSDIIRDSRGFIWISTWNGLNRFDGYNFITYKTGTDSNIPGMHNRISSVFEDRNGNMWVIMYDEKIFRLNIRTEKFESIAAFIPGTESMRIKTVFPSEDGDIWALTRNNGIIRIMTDEQSNKLEVVMHSLSNNNINVIYPDANSGLWIGTSSGIVFLHKQDGNYTEYSDLNHDADKVLCIEEFVGSVYFGGEGFLMRFDKENASWHEIALPKEGTITALAAGGQDSLIYFVMQYEGLFGYDPKSGRLQKFSGDSFDYDHIFIDSFGLLWIYSTDGNGIYKYDPATRHGEFLYSKRTVPGLVAGINKVVEKDTMVWVSLRGGGFGYYERKRGDLEFLQNNFNQYQSLSDVVSSMCVEPPGVVWISTTNRGLDQIMVIDRKVEHILLETESVNVSANAFRAMFCDRDGNSWFASRYGILYKFDSEMKLKKRFSTTQDGQMLGYIYTIRQDRDGSMWLGTKGNGLFKMEQQKNDNYLFTHYKNDPANRFSLSSDLVYDIHIDKYGNKWIGTYGGGINLLVDDHGHPIFLSHTNNFKNYPILNCNKVRSLNEDGDGNIWTGTTEGVVVIKYDSLTQTIATTRHIHEPEDVQSLSNGDILHIFRDSNNRMWLATLGGGLNCYLGINDSGKPGYRAYTTANGLPSNEIKCITEDKDGILWFASEHDICALDDSREILTTLSLQEGVDASMFSESAAITLPNGDILFGSLKGIYRIDKKRLINKNVAYDLQVTDYILNGQALAPEEDSPLPHAILKTGSISVPARYSSFGFRFVSLNYLIQNRVRYQYMLDGHDNVWMNDNGTRSALFKNVPAGKYTFRVRAFLPENLANYQERVLFVEVLPVFWITPVAYLLYGVVFFAVLGVWLKLRLRQKRIIKSLQESRVFRIGSSDIILDDDKDIKFLVRVMEWLEQNYADPNLLIEDMVSMSGLSRTAFYNRTKQLTGMSPIELVTDFRLKKAEIYLFETNRSIAEITYKVGFNEPAYFTRVFRVKYGMTPSRFRKKELERPAEAD
jgi:ligand-binding sensor domain-containing protein/AraC-like DNA-binding protein